VPFVHLTETCDEKQVHLITNVETSLAVTADVGLTAPIHAALAARDLLPGDHFLDAGYVDVELLVGSQYDHGVTLVGPVRPDVSWQAQGNQGYDISHFQIDWEGRRVTCPEGKTSVLWQPSRDAWGNSIIHAEFARTECLACPARPHCTRAQGQRISMLLKSQDFREEGRVHHAPHHLAAETVFDRMTLQERHGEASQPTQVVAQRAFTGATVVFSEVHIQHPVHRLDAPVAAHRFAETLAAEITAHDVEPRLVGLMAVGVLRHL
jgi:Transposase DDE domain